MKGAKITESEAKQKRLIPSLWDGNGFVLRWRVPDGHSFRPSLDGKIPCDWGYENGGRVKLWAFTVPPADAECIPLESMTEIQRAAYQASYHTAEREIAERRHYLGRCADKFSEMGWLMEMADSLEWFRAEIDGRMNRWGVPPQEVIYKESGMKYSPPTKQQKQKAVKAFESVRAELTKILGEWLVECMIERDVDHVREFADYLERAKAVQFHPSYWDNGVWHDTDSFTGTVFRCYKVLDLWKRHEAVPTKSGLEKYVRQEWLKMGGSETTVDTEFSGALRRLSLNGLPRASSRPLTRRKPSKVGKRK